MKNLVLEMSRQDKINPLSLWFNRKLDEYIADGVYANVSDLEKLKNITIERLVQYREQTDTSTAVVGISGGVDSALTASLLKAANWRVIGVVMPIHQDPEETQRGKEACMDLGINMTIKDLTALFDNTLKELAETDPELRISDGNRARIRRGNIRARLRMITLYNIASSLGGLVASTDNFSELAAGFWTLHGDVGDLSPIQSYLKSWEVPMLAKMMDVPEIIWRAKPTDGLGVDNGDEAQFGFSYLELDLTLLSVLNVINDGLLYDTLSSNNKWNIDGIGEHLGIYDDKYASQVYKMLMARIKNTWYKRLNPVNIRHALYPERYEMLEALDRDLFRPAIAKE